MSVIPELVNLANGSAAVGDDLAVKICRDAIAEIERLQAKLSRVRDWIKFAANAEGGIAAEIDDAAEAKEMSDESLAT
jgi:hypothetical protein